CRATNPLRHRGNGRPGHPSPGRPQASAQSHSRHAQHSTPAVIKQPQKSSHRYTATTRGRPSAFAATTAPGNRKITELFSPPTGQGQGPATGAGGASAAPASQDTVLGDWVQDD